MDSVKLNQFGQRTSRLHYLISSFSVQRFEYSQMEFKPSKTKNKKRMETGQVIQPDASKNLEKKKQKNVIDK